MTQNIPKNELGADTPASEARRAIRRGDFTGCTSGISLRHVQANVVSLPMCFAEAFTRYCQRNRRACPLLAVSEPGQTALPQLAAGLDIRTDLPRYRVFRYGWLIDQPFDVVSCFRADLVTLVLGCSFSFEGALRQAGIPLRHVDQGKNVAMYRTTRETAPAGPFHGPLCVSMRPIRGRDVARAAEVTGRFPLAHGAPVHVGDPAALGISDLARPDYGDAVRLQADEVPVFWACGVTSQLAVENAAPDLCITHHPGAMLICDLPHRALDGVMTL